MYWRREDVSCSPVTHCKSQKRVQYIRSGFTEVLKFVTTVWAVLILMGLGPFREGGNLSISEDTVSKYKQRLCTICKREERSDTTHSVRV